MKNLFLILMIFSVFFSCKTLHLSHKQQNNSFSYPLDSFINHNSKIQFLSANFMCNFSSSSNSNVFYGKFYINQDTSIFITVNTSFGLPLAQCLLTPDSVFIFVPLKNELYKADSSVFIKKFNIAINYYSLESLLLNQAFPYPSFNNLSNYNLSRKDSVFIFSDTLKNKRNSHIVDVLHYISSSKNFNVLSFYIKDFILNKTVNVNYSSFVLNSNNISFPTIISIDVPEMDSTNLNFNLKNIKFEQINNLQLNVKTNTHIISL